MPSGFGCRDCGVFRTSQKEWPPDRQTNSPPGPILYGQRGSGFLPGRAGFSLHRSRVNVTRNVDARDLTRRGRIPRVHPLQGSPRDGNQKLYRMPLPRGARFFQVTKVLCDLPLASRRRSALWAAPGTAARRPVRREIGAIRRGCLGRPRGSRELNIPLARPTGERCGKRHRTPRAKSP